MRVVDKHSSQRAVLHTNLYYGRTITMKKTCTRPEWSHEGNDYCPCDRGDFNEAISNGYDPCEDCSWYKEED